jgi:hypothetical protein
VTVIPGESVSLPSRAENNVVKININPTEYFLIENRTNWFRDFVSIDSVRYAEFLENDSYPAYVQLVADSIGATTDSNGVIVSIPDYDIGLPGSGLLIWHIDETVLQNGLSDYTINADRTLFGVDLEEADGAQDIGYPSIFLFTDPSAGYFGDMWYKGNLEYERANPNYEGMSPELGPLTFPDSRSNTGSSSYIRIGDISAPGDTMTFTVSNALLASGYPDTSLHIGLIHDFDGDGAMELVGGTDSIWVGSLTNRSTFYHPTGIVYDFSVDTNSTGSDDVVINELRNNSTVISLFSWNASDSTFDFLSDTSFSDDEVLFVDNPNWYSIRFTESTKADTFKTLAFNTESTELTYTLNGINLSLVDIDLDGNADVLTVDTLGFLSGSHFYFYSDVFYFFVNTQSDGMVSIAGFPVQIDSIEAQTPLVKDLFGDDHPEIVLQNALGEILIYNWKGNLEYRLTDYGSLICLGEYGGQNAIVTESAIWIFDAVSENYGNEWTSTHHDFGNSRTLVSSVPVTTPDESVLIDKSKTYVYPNPVEGNTATIRVQVESANAVEINIYDLGGYFVKKVDFDYVQEGLPNEYSWDVSNQEAGVYFARVTASKGSQSEEKIIKIGIIK